MAFSEMKLLLPSEQTSTWQITQVATVPWVYSETLQRRRVSDGEIARAWKAVIKGAVVGGTSWSWLFIHAEHMWFCWARLAGLLSTITVHTIGVSTWFYHDVRCWILRSKRVRYAQHPARWNSFGLIFPVHHIYICTLVWDFHKGRRLAASLWIVITYNLSNPRKEVAASWSQRSAGCVSCVRDELGMSTHAHEACSVQAIISDTYPQWRCLDYTELSWCNVSPTMVRTFIPIPVRLLLPFVRVIYTAVYAHTTCKPAVPPCKENVM